MASLSKLVKVNPLEVMINLSNKPFSPRLINWVEPIDVSGILKTVIYTEVDSNLKKGERVFIINGNYDSDLLIKSDKYRKGRDGYKVIDVDKCKIVLDIDYTGVLPWTEETIDNFIRVYPVRDSTEFRYVNRMITSENGNIDNKFSIYQDNVIFTENNYTGFSGFGENTGLVGAPGFFIKGGTGSWVDVTLDFSTNLPLFLSTYSSLNSNNRIKIMNSSFTYGGMEFKEGFVYKFENNQWVVDVTYFRPFISKANFRDGNFKGTWNAGLFGRQDKKIRWEGIQSNWNIGTLLNSIWATGSMNSIFTSDQSYFADIDEFGLPYQKINPPNNRGFGYNYVVDSEMNTTTITNGNFYGSLLGTQSATFSSVESYIKSWTQSLSVNVLGGEFNACTFESANVQASELKNSRLNNSKIIRTKSTNSNYTESLFYGSKFNSDNIIKILANDTWTVNVDPSNTSIQSTIYKFYISEENYFRMKHRDQFYISGALINDNEILNFFDKKFILSDYTYNEDEIISGPGAVKTGYDYTVRLNTSKENEYVISGTSVSGTNSNYLPSIDIHVQSVSTNLINGTIDTTNAYIIDSDFRSGLFERSDWNSGSLITHNYDNVIPNLSSLGGYYDISITTPGDNKLTISMPSPVAIDDDIIKVGSIVYLNSIDQVDVLSNITTLPDTYRISNIIPPRILILEEMASGTYSIIAGLTTSIYFTTTLDSNPIGNRYNYIHNVKINNSNIKSGIFRRSYLNKSVIYDQLYNNRDIDFTNVPNIKKLMLSEMIFRKTSNTINSGLITRSFITNGSESWNDGVFYNSSWIGQTFSNGVFRESRWENGTFVNGLFYKSNAKGGISAYASNYQSEKRQSYWRAGDVSNGSKLNDRYSWLNGTFLNGEFYKSGWEDGIFKNGRFYLSDWFNGTFSGGVLGDVSISTTDTNFYNGVFDNGVVDNANVYAKNTSFNPYSTTSPQLIVWNNGIFKSGVFGSTMYNDFDMEEFSNAIWNNGEFNGGTFKSNARWINGTFNGGKFISGFGWTVSTSTYSTDYSWQNGVFNGGEFGVGTVSTDKEFYTNGNSTWYTGEFNGGKFKGRVWNNGVLTSGDFEGSALTYSSISPLGSTCANPNNFTSTFNEDGLVLPHYLDFVPYNGYGPGTDPVWYNGVLYEYTEPFLLSAGPSPAPTYWTPATMSVYLKKYYGLWRNGTVTDVKDKHIKDKKIFTDVQRKYTEKKVTKSANLKNILWNTGTFSHPSGTMLNTVWLDGRFEHGTFKASSFNPYVKRNGATQATFNFDDNTCYWQNGTLDNSDFYISKWSDGKFLLGTGIGMIWQNGVANYMNAFNVFWENGTWRNGNWYGSSFALSGDGQVHDDYMMQILFRGMSWSGTSSCHVWNIFTEDPTDSTILANATASPATTYSAISVPVPPEIIGSPSG